MFTTHHKKHIFWNIKNEKYYLKHIIVVQKIVF